MFARYQTGPLVTLLFFAGVLACFLYGFVSVFHFQHHDGWINVVLAPLIFNRFHQRYSRGSGLL